MYQKSDVEQAAKTRCPWGSKKFPKYQEMKGKPLLQVFFTVPSYFMWMHSQAENDVNWHWLHEACDKILWAMDQIPIASKCQCGNPLHYTSLYFDSGTASARPSYMYNGFNMCEKRLDCKSAGGFESRKAMIVRLTPVEVLPHITLRGFQEHFIHKTFKTLHKLPKRFSLDPYVQWLISF